MSGIDGNLGNIEEFFATIVAAMGYVVVVVLYSTCILELQNRRSSYSKQKYRFLFVYITLLLLLSTLLFVQQIFSVTTSLFHPLESSPPKFIYIDPFGNGLHGGITYLLPFTFWGADGFMIWRCLALYRDVPTRYRILLIIVLFLLSLVSLGAGAITYMQLFMYGGALTTFLISLASGIANVILSCLTVLRLLYHQRYLSEVLGPGHGSVYTKIMVMCVESCALITLVCVVYICLFVGQDIRSVIPFFLLPHVCVISPFMAVYRVTKGIEATITTSPPTDIVRSPGHPRIEENLRFRSTIAS
ncbi:hypothetical protein GALMADRAFT_769087 [Galerina marginata CBS 339.88]|uniref:Uncharacterized protein n=1 Tax=Galerina marginata (strain CBS 339.88) TaxID=685588 RepID=A0A067SQJ6_GALM3|nr:hypothetical protein GALMADRAFT_769087 [Galerina marginata CBS 339.88]